MYQDDLVWYLNILRAYFQCPEFSFIPSGVIDLVTVDAVRRIFNQPSQKCKLDQLLDKFDYFSTDKIEDIKDDVRTLFPELHDANAIGYLGVTSGWE